MSFADTWEGLHLQRPQPSSVDAKLRLGKSGFPNASGLRHDAFHWLAGPKNSQRKLRMLRGRFRQLLNDRFGASGEWLSLVTTH